MNKVAYHRVINPKDVDRMANTADADQTALREKNTDGDLTQGPYNELVKAVRRWLWRSGKYQENGESYRINTPW